MIEFDDTNSYGIYQMAAAGDGDCPVGVYALVSGACQFGGSWPATVEVTA